MDFKVCKTCSEHKPADEFYFNVTADGGGNICQNCKRLRDGRWRAKQPEHVRKLNAEWRERNRQHVRDYRQRRARELREEVLAAYGGCCSCCGEQHYEFLTIDHVNGDGAEHRRAVHGKVYEEVRRRGFPDEFRVLCWNCNCSLGRYGYCPHGEREREVVPVGAGV